MYYQKRGGAYSFVYFDRTLKKNVRLSKSQVPHIENDEAAKAFCQFWKAKEDASFSRIQKKIGWLNKYHHFEEYLQYFEKDRKEDAPNSWQDSCNFLRRYVLPLFLEVKRENNLHNWYYHFEAFRDFLLETPPVQKVSGEKLAFETRNRIINTLNAFINTMVRRHVIDKPYKCRRFSSSNLKKRNVNSIILPDQQKAILKNLQKRDMLSADFFTASLHTGTRFNELLGISLADFFDQEIENEMIMKAIKPHGLKMLAVICLESQPALRTNPRAENGEVPRKPLKCKKRIDPEDCRIIPIFDVRTYRTLLTLWNVQQENFEVKKYGKDPKNYLLFEGLTMNSYSRNLRLAQKDLSYPKLFSPHDTRHTYTTWLAEATGGNYTLCRMILGHSQMDVTMRYVHINARMRLEMISRSQLLGPLHPVKRVNQDGLRYQNPLPKNSENLSEINRTQGNSHQSILLGR